MKTSIHYYFAQTEYGSGDYGASLYGGTETTSEGEPSGGLIDTGTPLFWGGMVGVSIIIATIWTLIATHRRRRNNAE
jgi:hypothetical protein